MRIEFRGKKAVIFIVAAIMVWILISYCGYRKALNRIDEAKGLLLTRIRLEISGITQALVKEMKLQKMGRKQSEEIYRRIAELTDIQLKILETRGGFLGGFYMKVEVTFGEKTPPDGERIRYYSIDCSVFNGFNFTTPLDIFRSRFLYDIAIWR
jgi:hypothetical protein